MFNFDLYNITIECVTSYTKIEMSCKPSVMRFKARCKKWYNYTTMQFALKIGGTIYSGVLRYFAIKLQYIVIILCNALHF